MHWIDILVIALLLISGAFAYVRGFVHEVLSVAGWVGAAFATIYGTPVLKHFTGQFIDSVFISSLVTGVLIFIITLAVLSIITRQISKGVKESALGALDRALGFLFGLLRGALIASLIWIGYEWYVPPEEQPDWVFEARTVPMLAHGANFLKSLVPSGEQGQNKQPAQTAPNASRQSDDGKSLLDRAIDLAPKAPEDKQGYDQKERKEMDRLFETSQ